MIYISLYEYLFKSFDKLNEYQIQFIEKIKYIIIHFLYESPIEPINVSSLITELTSLNSIIEQFNIDHSSKKIEYLEESQTTSSNVKSVKSVKKEMGGKINTRRNNTRKINTRRKVGTRKNKK